MFKTEATILFFHAEQDGQGSCGTVGRPSLQLLEELKQRLGVHGVHCSEWWEELRAVHCSEWWEELHGGCAAVSSGRSSMVGALE